MQFRLLSFICILYSLNIFAYSPTDSIGVENRDGKKVIIHKVEAKENYYSIGRKYQVSPRAIMDFNGNIALKIGTILNIPTDQPYIESTASATPSTSTSTATATATTTSTSKNTDEFLDYKVGAGETLFGIAGRFNTTVEDIKELNNLRSNNLRNGQTLKVRKGPPPAPEPETVIISDSAETALNIPPNRYGLKEHSERGIAVWIVEEGLDENRMLALHNTAPVGTVIKVTNTMNDKSTFVKVVGKFAYNEINKDAIIVLTKATADLLGVLDKRFQVSIDYGANE